jgi:hypothetical protein
MAIAAQDAKKIYLAAMTGISRRFWNIPAI